MMTDVREGRSKSYWNLKTFLSGHVFRVYDTFKTTVFLSFFFFLQALCSVLCAGKIRLYLKVFWIKTKILNDDVHKKYNVSLESMLK